MMRQFQGAIFDLDGTLLDSMGVWNQIDIDFFHDRNMELPEDFQAAISHMGSRMAAEYTIQRFHLTDTAEELMAVWDRMARKAYAQAVPLKPHAKEYLEMLKARGVKLAIATASTPELFLPSLRHNGVCDLFDAIVTLDEVGSHKGTPDIYLEAARRIGLAAADCVVFEDLYECILAAKRGGFYTVAVEEPTSGLDRVRLLREADWFIRDFGDLLEQNS